MSSTGDDIALNNDGTRVADPLASVSDDQSTAQAGPMDWRGFARANSVIRYVFSAINTTCRGIAIYRSARVISDRLKRISSLPVHEAVALVCCMWIEDPAIALHGERGILMADDVSRLEFDDFARSIRRWLRAEAYHLCGDWFESDDLVQIALCKLQQRWDRLDRHNELGAYARRIVVHSLLTERRRARWRLEVSTPIEADAVANSAAYAAVEDRAVLLPALQRLGSRQRAVLALRFLHDLSVEQTAQTLGCSPGTVTSQTVRALASLRRDLAM